MLRSGLVSITFRRLSPRAIVELVSRAGLEGVEWGGDVHVPHGDPAAAADVRKLTADAGLAVAAYGSYYRAGHGEPVPFEAVRDTAAALGARLVRVWAGKAGSADADSAYRAAVRDDLARCCDLAAQAGLAIVTEWHGGTLTDTTESALALLQAVGRPNLRTYWQPPQGASRADCLAGLEAARPYLGGLHVFSWTGRPPTRLDLSEHQDRWRAYLAHADRPVVPASGAGDDDEGRDMFVLLEFVKGDAPEQFLRDAATLRRWLAELRPPHRV